MNSFDTQKLISDDDVTFDADGVDSSTVHFLDFIPAKIPIRFLQDSDTDYSREYSIVKHHMESL